MYKIMLKPVSTVKISLSYHHLHTDVDFIVASVYFLYYSLMFKSTGKTAE